ncbi:hypothetical protein [Hymenobacter volaticus]|uniref:Uncharacterized protein n=1 Tax=Hymenobacter volaticus TaxID=2932254 RepID=A0ABY4GEG3_9BACT|nr:hypothetical protein [Hymenobacter volaticus]UOQ69185.1 hypothetical protein MUN86_26080 [Hymenobacter volaticus]
MTSSFYQFWLTGRLSFSDSRSSYRVLVCYGLVLCALLFQPFTAWADEWHVPKTVDYYSADSSYCLRVVPTFVPAKYSRWQTASPKKKRRYTPQDTTLIPCYATLFHRVHQDLVPVWRHELVNPFAPMQALVSNDGRYVVTLDDWYQPGYGENVVVVYDQQGTLRKRATLETLSPYPLDQYRLSITSRWWRCHARFVDNTTLELCFRNELGGKTSKEYVVPELLLI